MIPVQRAFYLGTFIEVIPVRRVFYWGTFIRVIPVRRVSYWRTFIRVIPLRRVSYWGTFIKAIFVRRVSYWGTFTGLIPVRRVFYWGDVYLSDPCTADLLPGTFFIWSGPFTAGCLLGDVYGVLYWTGKTLIRANRQSGKLLPRNGV